MAGKNYFCLNPDNMANTYNYESKGNNQFRNDQNQWYKQNKNVMNQGGSNNFYFSRGNDQEDYNLPGPSAIIPRTDNTYKYDPAACLPSQESSDGMQSPLIEVCLPKPQGYPPYIPQVPVFPYTSCLPTFPPPFNPNFPIVRPINVPLPPPTFNRGKYIKKSVQGWLNTRRIPSKDAIMDKPTKIAISISEYKRRVSTLAISIRDLENLTAQLKVMCKSLDEKEWRSRKVEICQQKTVVKRAEDDLKAIPEEAILGLLKKRLSRRIRLKRKRTEYKELKKEKKVLCQLEHSRIDLWLEKMKEQLETAKRDEDIKKQADFVLAEVFLKKSEAKRMLTLLTTMGKLRNARIQDRESKKEFVSKEAAAAFNTIIESLKKRWIDQINGYSVEENGLRVMLSDAQVERSNVEIALNKQIQYRWLNILFGNNCHISKTNNPIEVATMDQLVAVREKWDKFIVEDDETSGSKQLVTIRENWEDIIEEDFDIPISSSIPCGWVLPVPPSNQQWALFLDK